MGTHGLVRPSPCRQLAGFDANVWAFAAKLQGSYKSALNDCWKS